MKAVIYARYSSDLQNDRSIEDQNNYCLTWARKNGFQIMRGYEDRAISGSKFKDRYGLMELVRDAKAHKFEAVIVEHSDRLSRHPADIHTIREELNFAGVKIVQVGGTELDAMQASVSGLVSSMFLDGLAKKVWRGQSGNIGEGLSAGGKAYGFAPVKGEPGQLQIVPAEADVVRRVFKEYLDRKTSREIAAGLNRDRIPSPRGGKWNASTIVGSKGRGNGILCNELYAGVLVWNKVKMVRNPESRRRISRINPPDLWRRHEMPELAIVDRATFDAVQIKKGNIKRPQQGKRPKRLLSGLLRCPQCGGGMFIKDKRGNYLRIQCSTRHENKGCSNSQTYNLGRIEKAVVKSMRGFIEDHEAIQLYIDTYNAERLRLADTRSTRREDVEREIVQVTAKLDKAVSMMLEGTASHETMRPHIASLEARKALLEGELVEAPAEVITLRQGALARLRGQLSDLDQVIPTSGADVIEAFRQMVTSVTVGHDYTLRIEGTLGSVTVAEGEQIPPPQGWGDTMVAGARIVQNPPLKSPGFFLVTAA